VIKLCSFVLRNENLVTYGAMLTFGRPVAVQVGATAASTTSV
jgi:hypothetical protein